MAAAVSSCAGEAATDGAHRSWRLKRTRQASAPPRVTQPYASPQVALDFAVVGIHGAQRGAQLVKSIAASGIVMRAVRQAPWSSTCCPTSLGLARGRRRVDRAGGRDGSRIPSDVEALVQRSEAAGSASPWLELTRGGHKATLALMFGSGRWADR